jgi:hypothetical protein
MADIIFLGWSRLIFGLDWRVFEAFEMQMLNQCVTSA